MEDHEVWVPSAPSGKRASVLAEPTGPRTLAERLRARLASLRYPSRSGGWKAFRSHHVEALMQCLLPFIQVELAAAAHSRSHVVDGACSEEKARALRAAIESLRTDMIMAERFGRPAAAAEAASCIRVLEGMLPAAPDLPRPPRFRIAG